MQSHTTSHAGRPRTVIACTANGTPRTFRLAPASRDAAYRRLAVAILGLDVAALSAELRSARRSVQHLSLARAA
ncbi:MAG TPA: hypothetical protein VGL99_27145 [Chloroflexota bacterium]|jgi:hypothetical protein